MDIFYHSSSRAFLPAICANPICTKYQLSSLLYDEIFHSINNILFKSFS
ncbi:hypothetical protein QW060_25335 [Myroides ceti]|uniref:Uncharacterized protein n=1 Tax=Paenimyroides ceti TaxID=395087 RepID=A0ABT8D2Q5_9FLAO|nr:hypothetical protein [Paenimyroides ceti]MDN3710196.1 hypothetical protein [Paenimyroides ceti]